ENRSGQLPELSLTACHLFAWGRGRHAFELRAPLARIAPAASNQRRPAHRPVNAEQSPRSARPENERHDLRLRGWRLSKPGRKRPVGDFSGIARLGWHDSSRGNKLAGKLESKHARECEP